MIAWALVGPIPGNASSSSAVAVLILTLPPVAAVDLPVGDKGLVEVLSLPVVPDDLVLVAVESEDLVPVLAEVVSSSVDFAERFFVVFPDLAVVVEPNLTCPFIASTFALPRPLTFSRSEYDLYGRPSIIF